MKKRLSQVFQFLPWNQNGDRQKIVINEEEWELHVIDINPAS
jgi:hypothetical protein